MPPPSSKSPYRLLVEGKDDKYSVIQLLARHGYDWEDGSKERPYIEDASGASEVLDALVTALKNYRRLGVVMDADLAPTNRWAQIRDRAASLGVSLPQTPEAEGTIVAWEDRRLGVWLMPDNAAPGKLEDFLAHLVPQGDPCWTHANEATSSARALGARLKEADHAKGRLHAWLAWQEIPGQPFGTAITSHVLMHDSPEALRFVSWFRRLFLDP